jgi:hypothetical protein
MKNVPEMIPEMIPDMIPEMIPEMMHPLALVIRFASRVVVVGSPIWGPCSVSIGFCPVAARKTTATFKS